jgi:hypothetical protein
LGYYIQQQQPPGNIILVGYSLGGLVARDLIANDYYNFLTAHPVTALITLGTPNLGYPWSSIDPYIPGMCAQMLQDMSGSWGETASSWYELTSPYLDALRTKWVSASHPPGYWMAAAGEQCPTTPTPGVGVERNFPFLSEVGCPAMSNTSDGVVCRDSALYGGSFGPYLNDGPKPYVPWYDTAHTYVHTHVLGGFGTSGLLCGNTSQNIELFNPDPSGTLFPYITAVINAH